MKITFEVYKKLMSEKQKSIWEKSLKVIGEKNEKRFYNTIIEMCKVYGIKKIVPGSEEFLVAKTFMEKVIKSEKYLNESVQAGDISGVSPSLGANPIYPSSYFSKKPVFGVDLKTIEKFLIPKDDTKKDDKKKIKSKMKDKWVNFLVDESESEDLKMALIGVKKEGFYLNYGKLFVEYNENVEKKTLNEEGFDKISNIVEDIRNVAGEEIEVETHDSYITVYGSELSILRIIYRLGKYFIHHNVDEQEGKWVLEIHQINSEYERDKEYGEI